MAFLVGDSVVVKKLKTSGLQEYPDITGRIKAVLGGSTYTLECNTNVDRVNLTKAYPTGVIPESAIHAA